MIVIHVNGKRKTVLPHCCIADALQQWGYQPHAIAVAINGEFIPRSVYREQQLVEGDHIDIVAPIQGG